MTCLTVPMSELVICAAMMETATSRPRGDHNRGCACKILAAQAMVKTIGAPARR